MEGSGSGFVVGVKRIIMGGARCWHRAALGVEHTRSSVSTTINSTKQTGIFHSGESNASGWLVGGRG